MIFLTFIFGIILAIMLFSGVVKGVKFTFNGLPPPPEKTESVTKIQSEKAMDLQEKNRQLMDRVKEKMERNRR